jgi:hypothetical protein
MLSYEFASSSVLRPAASPDRRQGGMQDLKELRLEKPQGPLAALLVPLASLNPPINPAWPQAAGPAQSPSPFYVAEPHYSPFS